MKRIVGCLLALAVSVCFSTVVGCGDGANDDPETRKQVEEAMERETQEIQEQLPVDID